MISLSRQTLENEHPNIDQGVLVAMWLACLQGGTRTHGEWPLRLMMGMEKARQKNETNRAISIVKRRTDCPTRLEH